LGGDSCGAVHVRNDLYKKPPARKLFISRLLRNNQPDSSVFETGSKTFSYKENNLVFEFSAISFRDESKVQYSYQLINDKDSTQWSVPQKIHAVSFASLAPGSYTIKIKAVTAEMFGARYQRSIVLSSPLLFGTPGGSDLLRY
jgi:hypothetical protein